MQRSLVLPRDSRHLKELTALSLAALAIIAVMVAVVLGIFSWRLGLLVALSPLLAVIPQGSLGYVLIDAWSLDALSLVFHPLVSTSTMALGFWAVYLVAQRGHNGKLPALRWNFLHLLLVAFFGYLSLSYWLTTGSFDPTILYNCVFYFLLLTAMSTLKQIRLFVWVAVAGGFVLTTSGLVQMAIEGLPPGGITGLGANHVQPAFFVLLSLPLLVALAAEQVRPWNLLTALLGALFLVVILASFSRGVIAGLVVGLLLWMAWRRHRIALAALVILAGLVLLVGARSGNIAVLERISPLLESSQELNQFSNGRVVLLSAAWNMFQTSPITGMGYQSYKALWASYAPPEHFGYLATPLLADERSAHSTYLQIMAELGAVGLALYLVILGLALWNTWRAGEVFRSLGDQRSAHLLTIGVAVSVALFALHGLLDNSGWHDRPFYFFLALAVALRAHAESMAPLEDA